MGKRQEKDSKDSLEQEILELVRLKLYQRMRGLGPLLGALEFRTEAPKRAEEKGRFCTDGKIFYLDGKRLRAEFLEDSGRLCLELLHMLCHCLLGHPYQAWRVENRREWERECDRQAWRLVEKLWGALLPFRKEAERLLKEGKRRRHPSSLWTVMTAGDAETTGRPPGGRARARGS